MKSIRYTFLKTLIALVYDNGEIIHCSKEFEVATIKVFCFEECVTYTFHCSYDNLDLKVEKRARESRFGITGTKDELYSIEFTGLGFKVTLKELMCKVKNLTMNIFCDSPDGNIYKLGAKQVYEIEASGMEIAIAENLGNIRFGVDGKLLFIKAEDRNNLKINGKVVAKMGSFGRSLTPMRIWRLPRGIGFVYPAITIAVYSDEGKAELNDISANLLTMQDLLMGVADV